MHIVFCIICYLSVKQDNLKEELKIYFLDGYIFFFQIAKKLQRDDVRERNRQYCMYWSL